MKAPFFLMPDDFLRQIKRHHGLMAICAPRLLVVVKRGVAQRALALVGGVNPDSLCCTSLFVAHSDQRKRSLILKSKFSGHRQALPSPTPMMIKAAR